MKSSHTSRLVAFLAGSFLSFGFPLLTLPLAIAHEHGHHHGASQGGAAHQHPQVSIPPGQPTPTVTLTLQPDARRGWNVHVDTENFVFAPERVNQSSLTTEGHAHLYLNGELIARLYGPWYHLPALPPGEHELVVTLNTNQHEDLVQADTIIQASTTVIVPQAES